VETRLSQALINEAKN
jgi:Ca2+-binding EF-hand superfamily protein